MNGSLWNLNQLFSSNSVSFNLERKRLSFTPVLEQDNPNIGIYAEAEGGADATLNYLGMDLFVETGEPGYVTTLVNATTPPEDDSRVGELLSTWKCSGAAGGDSG